MKLRRSALVNLRSAFPNAADSACFIRREASLMNGPVCTLPAAVALAFGQHHRTFKTFDDSGTIDQQEFAEGQAAVRDHRSKESCQ